MEAKLKTIVTLAVLGAVVPFLGIPLTWKMWLSGIFSLAVAVIAYTTIARSTRAPKQQQSSSEDAPFAEHHPEHTSQSTEQEDTYAS